MTPQPNFSNAAAYRAWLSDCYPAQVAKLIDIPAAPPRDDYNTDNRAEIASRKRAIARMMFEGACKLMEEAESIEDAVEKEKS